MKIYHIPIAVLSVFFIFYLISSFVQWNMNPGNWSMDLRFWTISISLILSIFVGYVMSIYYFKK